MRRIASVLLVMTAATACGSSTPDVAGGGSDGVVAIGQTGAVARGDDPREPVPVGTTFTYEGWSATVEKAETTTQPNADPANPFAVVVQMDLRVTAGDNVADYTAGTPFEPRPETNQTAMVECRAPAPFAPMNPGEVRTISTCHAYKGSRAVVDAPPSGAIVVRYGAFQQVAKVYVALNRGPDY